MAFSCLLKIVLCDRAGLAGLPVFPWHGGGAGSSAWAAAFTVPSRAACHPAPSGPCDVPWQPAHTGECPFSAGGDTGARRHPPWEEVLGKMLLLCIRVWVLVWCGGSIPAPVPTLH